MNKINMVKTLTEGITKIKGITLRGITSREKKLYILGGRGGGPNFCAAVIFSAFVVFLANVTGI